ncbi:nitrate reductase molybdenum cofactor assembly chaperone [Budviciaceae bacterium CWB-B4]|uniref:Nitrate reductase molybdenum cofactor assembly chaperone n=1 Tax=Limnobaculum xujianqingii TaxID=2738837 RepID=A0A9D7AFE7_9GAMM|nr:nitrate reductase molybdenum cofactor assembly chaperone [Limnobaculum xujianqingii]MBK5071752.1 nitrate reductase molybdenum cofactor assembly chaperone [Limnobaculum xujianqingii]MBK5175061.1 nitrate reductase molybdenum cofactor assembly chaperone [Limnobaculum xujianqingii]
MISLKILSYLLEYPDQALWQGADELLAATAEADELTAEQKSALAALIHWRCQGNLLDAQEEYSSLFDRGRATSLLLFEHVHGESRDRGQAMVDLLDQYKQAGLQIDSCELPDHLPLFLEFLSVLDESQARGWLQDIAAILALLGARLHERDSGYAALFDLLTDISGSEARSANLKETVSAEARDDTPQALDAVWEEEQVKFIDAQSQNECGNSAQQAHQRRFAGAVAPQYLSVESASARTGGNPV